MLSGSSVIALGSCCQQTVLYWGVIASVTLCISEGSLASHLAVCLASSPLSNTPRISVPFSKRHKGFWAYSPPPPKAEGERWYLQTHKLIITLFSSCGWISPSSPLPFPTLNSYLVRREGLFLETSLSPLALSQPPNTKQRLVILW